MASNNTISFNLKSQIFLFFFFCSLALKGTMGGCEKTKKCIQKQREFDFQSLLSRFLYPFKRFWENWNFCDLKDPFGPTYAEKIEEKRSKSCSESLHSEWLLKLFENFTMETWNWTKLQDFLRQKMFKMKTATISRLQLIFCMKIATIFRIFTTISGISRLKSLRTSKKPFF